MKKNILLACFIALVPNAYAQTFSLSGRVLDSLAQPMIGANVQLLSLRDSSQVAGVNTDAEGRFLLPNLRPRPYRLRISYLGYQDYSVVHRLMEQDKDLGNIILRENTSQLTEVNVTAAVSPVSLKGDTTEIKASAFKTNPDANVEDLLTKMPGITVQNGKVQAQGEDVQRVTVDGKTFFGEDANVALKNLQAEMVDKVQIFDKKSDQSELTGFDDGNTTKTINIITKLQFRNGTFGKAYAGYGVEDKWKSGLNYNKFKDKRKLSILANSNNINEQNFSSDDLLGVMSSSSAAPSGGGGMGGGGRRGGGGMGGRPGQQPSDASNFLVDQRGGVNTTHAAGINFVDEWKKVEFMGSYFFNYSQNDAQSDLFRQYVNNESSKLTYKEQNGSSNRNINHRATFKIDWKIDSMNKLTFQPRFSVQENKSSSSVLGFNNLQTVLLSNSSNLSGANLTGINFSAPINYQRTFEKKRRLLTLNLTPGYTKSSGQNNLNSASAFYTTPLETDSLNQQGNRNVQGYTLSSNINFVEPIGEKTQLMFGYSSNYNRNISDKNTFDFNRASDAYNLLDTALSNNFNSTYFAQSVNVNYRYQAAKFNFMVGASYQYATLNGEQLYPVDFKVERSFHNILPVARAMFRFSKRTNLNVMLRSNNTIPTINQLQSVINNTNPLQLSTGNPELKQDWQNNLVLRYSNTNPEKNTSFFAMLGGGFTQNQIVNSTFIATADTLVATGIVLRQGSQLSKPVNLDGYFNIRTFNTYSMPLNGSKTYLNLNLGGTYSRTPGLINQRLNYANSYNAGLGAVLSSNISERLDFILSSNTTYNNISNTLQASLNSTYINQATKVKVQALPWKWLSLQTEVSHQYNGGLSTSYNQHFFLWNAFAAYKFLKNNAAELRLSVFDILHQNNSISRNTAENYYEDVRTNVLQQFFMLTFTYNFKNFAEAKGK